MKVKWSKDALRDRKSLVRFIAEQRSVAAAFSVDDRIAESVQMLEDYPLLGKSGRAANTRELIIGATRYIAIYHIEDGRPLVLRVLHQSQQWPPDDDLTAR